MSSTHNRTLTPSELRVAHGGRGTGTIPAFQRRFVLASVVAVAVALGYPTLASAAPEWDFGFYEACVSGALVDYQRGEITFQQYNGAVKDCCAISDGIWSESQGCVAPPANAPGRTVPPDLPTQTLAPDLPFAPPGDITQTFTPAIGRANGVVAKPIAVVYEVVRSRAPLTTIQPVRCS